MVNVLHNLNMELGHQDVQHHCLAIPVVPEHLGHGNMQLSQLGHWDVLHRLALHVVPQHLGLRNQQHRHRHKPWDPWKCQHNWQPLLGIFTDSPAIKKVKTVGKVSTVSAANLPGVSTDVYDDEAVTRVNVGQEGENTVLSLVQTRRWSHQTSQQASISAAAADGSTAPLVAGLRNHCTTKTTTTRHYSSENDIAGQENKINPNSGPKFSGDLVPSCHDQLLQHGRQEVLQPLALQIGGQGCQIFQQIGLLQLLHSTYFPYLKLEICKMAWLSITNLGMATSIMLIMSSYLVELFTEIDTNMFNKFGYIFFLLSMCSRTDFNLHSQLLDSEQGQHSLHLLGLVAGAHLHQQGHNGQPLLGVTSANLHQLPGIIEVSHVFQIMNQKLLVSFEVPYNGV